MKQEQRLHPYSLAVIIPCYNKEKYLAQCIVSVLNQTLLPEEIIVVDDCSQDSSRKIIEEFEKKSCLIKKVFLETNGGVSHARNVGLDKASTKYVTFLDADDFYGNRNKLYNEMKLIKNHSKDIVSYSKLMFCDETGKIQSRLPSLNSTYLNGNIYKKMLGGDFCMDTIARDFCVKKQCILNVGGYNEKRSLYEDLELIIRLAKEYDFYCTNDTGTVYRNVAGGLSKQNAKKNREVRNEIFYENIHFLHGLDKINTTLRWYIWHIRRIQSRIFYIIVDCLKVVKRILLKYKLTEKNK